MDEHPLLRWLRKKAETAESYEALSSQYLAPFSITCAK